MTTRYCTSANSSKVTEDLFGVHFECLHFLDMEIPESGIQTFEVTPVYFSFYLRRNYETPKKIT